MGKSVWIVACLCLVGFACAERNTSTTEPNPPGKGADVTFDDDDFRGWLYKSDNPFTESTLARVTRRADIEREINYYGSLGYRFSRNHSFVVEGESKDRGTSRIAILSFANAIDEDKDAVYLFVVRRGQAVGINPAKLSFEPVATDGFAEIAEGVWLGPFERSVAETFDGPDRAAFDWGDYLKCVSTELAGAAIACAMTCRYVPMGYLQCFGICTSGAGLKAVATCAFEQS